MNNVPVIALVGKLPSSEWCGAFKLLESLENTGAITLQKVPVGTDISSIAPHPNAILCRPSRGGYIDEALLKGIPRPLFIASLSKGVDHISLDDYCGIEIISVKGRGNAIAVAEHTITLTNELLRPAYAASRHMAQGGFTLPVEEVSRQLNTLTWGCIGAGEQVKHLIPLLVAHGCRSITIFNRRMDKNRLENVLAGISNFAGRLEIIKSNASTEKENQAAEKLFSTSFNNTIGDTVKVEASTNVENIFSNSDIISLHIPAASNTKDLICSKSIAKFHKRPFIVNPARGELVNEKDIISALKDKRISGYAADVVSKEAEKEGNPLLSPIWMQFQEQAKGAPNSLPSNKIFLTPHIGGATIDALNIVADEVIGKLLNVLNIELKDT